MHVSYNKLSPKKVSYNNQLINEWNQIFINDTIKILYPFLVSSNKCAFKIKSY